MIKLLPAQAANLAADIYTVNGSNSDDFEDFLEHPLFCSSNTKAVLNARVGGHIILSATDAFGVCAVGVDGDLFLIFRGTTEANNKADFITDARIGFSLSDNGLPVHSGFNHTFKSVKGEIETFINNAHSSGKIFCIGHSLGGAVASLAADWVKSRYSNAVKLYTFGAPRVGGFFFTRKTTSRILEANFQRVYHRTDPVPMVPLFPFSHAPSSGKSYFLPSSEPLSTGNAHKMVSYISSVKGKSWAQISDIPEEPYTIETAIEHWLRSKSPIDTNSATFWQWVNSAMAYVLKKVSMTAFIAIQGVGYGLHTVMDKIAYILAKGIDLAEDISSWVKHLMYKLMRAIGMRPPKDDKSFTKAFIQRVLILVTQKANEYARKALKGNTY